MTQEEIINKGSFGLNEPHKSFTEFKITLHLKLFNKEQEIVFYNLPSVDSKPHMSLITEIINELLELDNDVKDQFKEEAWKHYQTCIEITSYGMVPDEGFENERDANEAYFKIYTKDDAYNALTLDEIQTDIEDINSKGYHFSFDCPWDDEHGLTFSVSNRKIYDVCC